MFEDYQELTLTSSSPAGRAKISQVSLRNVPALMGGRADYGLKSPALFANLDLDLSCWKTPQVSLFGGWTEFSAIWPQAGMMRNGTCFRLRPSAPITYERASGYLPTPLASETGWRKKPFSQGGTSLSTMLGGVPNPAFVEWMQGLPTGFTDLRL